MVALLWFRRDLRLTDHEALSAAARQAAGSGCAGVYVLDPVLLDGLGRRRRHRLLASLRCLDESIDGALWVRSGDPRVVIPALARELQAGEVFVTGETTPFGRARDAAVAQALGAHASWNPVGTPYAVAPGTLRTGSGTAYRVFTPFFRAWRERVLALPLTGAASPCQPQPAAPVRWLPDPQRAASDRLPWPAPAHSELTGTAGAGGPLVDRAGEAAAWDQWEDFRQRLAHYPTQRDRADADGTSGLSVHLKWGEIHPRSLIAAALTQGASNHVQRRPQSSEYSSEQPGQDPGGEAAPGEEAAWAFIRQLAWREFYADVLWHRPDSRWRSLDTRFDDQFVWDWSRGLVTAQAARLTSPSDRSARGNFEAWCAGQTGYPFIDAAMRELRERGTQPNRARMACASFLVKDLLIPWQVGARWYLENLADADVANNQHGWQWTAGCGTDAAPFFRVFNPVRQGQVADPDGHYVRHWVPELAHLPAPAVHQPWTLSDHERPAGYPTPIVDHAAARARALAAYRELPPRATATTHPGR